MVEDIIKNIHTYAFMMKRSLDLDAVVDAFKHARKFIDCLKTGELTPSNYNQIYLEAQTNLLYLRSQLHDPRFQDNMKFQNTKPAVYLVYIAWSPSPLNSFIEKSSKF